MMGRWNWLGSAGLLVGLLLPGTVALAEPSAAGLELVWGVQGEQTAMR